MSWLLAASFPALLMLAALALDRIESGIGPRDARAGAELTTRAPRRPHNPDHTGPVRVTPARTEPRPAAPTRALPSLRAGADRFTDEPGLPTRLVRHVVANPQFQPTRQPNRV